MNTKDEMANNSTGSFAEVSYEIIEEPFAVCVIRLVLFGILFLTAIIGNASVFTAPWRNARLRTFSYCLITCLAIGDFISTLGLPFTLVTEQLGYNWIFGRVLCNVLNPTQVACGMVTTNIHTAISVDRFMSVAYPFRGKPRGYRQILIVALIWLTAILFALPAYGTRKLVPYHFEDGTSFNLCLEIFPAFKYERVYTLFLLTVNYALPIVVMSTMYTTVIIILRRQAGRYRYGRQSSPPPDGGTQTQTDVERKFIRMAFIIMLVFVLCYLPYQVMFALMHFGVLTRLSYGFVMFDYAYLITWIPNAVNPLVYGAMDRYYAKAYRKIFNCLSRSREELRATYFASNERVRKVSKDLCQIELNDNEQETDC